MLTIKKRVLLRTLALFMAFFSTNAQSQPRVELIKLAENIDGTPTATASIYSETTSGVQIDTTVPGSLASADKVLQKYYFNLNEGDLKEIKSLHFSADGSQAWISQDVQKNAAKYNGSIGIEKINILKRIFWGEYTIFFIELIKSGKPVTKWVDAAVCPDGKCYISSLLFNPQVSSDILSAVMFYNKPDRRILKNITHDISFDVESEYGSRYPLTINLDVKKAQGSGPKEIFPKLIESGEYKNISQYIHEAISLKKTSMRNSFENDNFEEKFGKINKKYYLNFDGEYAFQQYRNDSSFLHAAYFSNVAFVQLLARFDRFVVAGEIESGNERFVLVKGYDADQVFPFLFIMDTSGQLKQVAENVVLSQILFADRSVRVIQDWMR